MYPTETALLPSISPEPVTHLPQNRLLPLLLERAERYSGTTARVRFGAKVTGVKEIGDQVTVTIEKDSPRSVVFIHHHLSSMLVVMIIWRVE